MQRRSPAHGSFDPALTAAATIVALRSSVGPPGSPRAAAPLCLLPMSHSACSALLASRVSDALIRWQAFPRGSCLKARWSQLKSTEAAAAAAPARSSRCCSCCCSRCCALTRLATSCAHFCRHDSSRRATLSRDWFCPHSLGRMSTAAANTMRCQVFFRRGNALPERSQASR